MGRDNPKCQPNYNRCPTQTAPVLAVVDGKLQFKNMRWGLVPAWAKSVKDADKYSMINARAEEITEKRSYKTAFKKRRCLVPVSGFYEWQRSQEMKIPFAIYLKNEPIMSIGGIWEYWEGEGQEQPVLSYALITMTANSSMTFIHDRMPLILSREQEEKWLSPDLTEEKDIFPLMTGCRPEDLGSHPVSKRVNSIKNNEPGLIERVS